MNVVMGNFQKTEGGGQGSGRRQWSVVGGQKGRDRCQRPDVSDQKGKERKGISRKKAQKSKR